MRGRLYQSKDFKNPLFLSLAENIRVLAKTGIISPHVRFYQEGVWSLENEAGKLIEAVGTWDSAGNCYLVEQYPIQLQCRGGRPIMKCDRLLRKERKEFPLLLFLNRYHKTLLLDNRNCFVQPAQEENTFFLMKDFYGKLPFDFYHVDEEGLNVLGTCLTKDCLE